MCNGNSHCHHHPSPRARVNSVPSGTQFTSGEHGGEVLEAVTTDGGDTYVTVESLGFTGSYRAEDCIFLMHQLGGSDQIQGDEMPCWEEPPAQAYRDLYEHAMQHSAARVAHEVMALADAITTNLPGERITIASLARAGTPYGVLLRRALVMLGYEPLHFSISLIRGVGVDHAALDKIRKLDHGPIVFIDGWTGKGGISRHLRESVERYNASRPSAFLPVQLACVADLAGTSVMAGTTEDYLMPSAMLDAPMNGLVSKTFANSQADELHGAYLYGHLAAHDLSNDFVDRVTVHLPIAMFANRGGTRSIASRADIGNQRVRAKREVKRIASEFGIGNEDEIKAGYNETLRAVQRRAMKFLLLKNPSTPANAALVALANQLGIRVVDAPNMMFECVGICGDRV